MTQSEQEHRLRLFVKIVESGRQPSAKQLEFIAQGVQRFLKHEKPWQITQGRKKRAAMYSTQNKMICAHLLNEIKVDRARIALLFDNTSESTLKRYIKDGKSLCAGWDSGFHNCLFGIEQLLKDYPLKPSEKAKLKEYGQQLQTYSDRLNKESGYF